MIVDRCLGSGNSGVVEGTFWRSRALLGLIAGLRGSWLGLDVRDIEARILDGLVDVEDVLAEGVLEESSEGGVARIPHDGVEDDLPAVVSCGGVPHVDEVVVLVHTADAALDVGEVLGPSHKSQGHLQAENIGGVSFECIMGVRHLLRQRHPGVGIDGRRALDPAMMLESLEKIPDGAHKEPEQLATLLGVASPSGLIAEGLVEDRVSKTSHLFFGVDEVLAGVDELLSSLEDAGRLGP